MAQVDPADAASPRPSNPTSLPESFPSPGAAAEYRTPPEVDVTPPEPAAALPPQASVQAGAELVDRRTAASKTFVGDASGQLRTVLYDGPVHYRDDQGRWAEIDTTLGPKRSNGRRYATANAFDLSMADSAADPAIVRLGLDQDHSVGFGLDGAPGLTARAERDAVVYSGAAKATDLRLTSRSGGVKEELILASPEASDRYVFPLELRGLTASLDEEGNVVYRDDARTVRARTPHGFMTDSAIDPPLGRGADLAGRRLRPHPLGSRNGPGGPPRPCLAG